MLQLRIYVPSALADPVLQALDADPGVSALAIVRDASIRPPGHLIMADVAREAANDVIERLGQLGVPRDGTIHIDPAPTWISQAGFTAERRVPGSSADAVVWADGVQRSYDHSELHWT